MSNGETALDRASMSYVDPEGGHSLRRGKRLAKMRFRYVHDIVVWQFGIFCTCTEMMDDTVVFFWNHGPSRLEIGLGLMRFDS